MRMMKYFLAVLIVIGFAGIVPQTASAAGLQLHKHAGAQGSVVRIADRQCLKDYCGRKRWRRDGFGSRRECNRHYAQNECNVDATSPQDSRDECILEYCSDGQWRQRGYSDEFHCMEQCR